MMVNLPLLNTGVTPFNGMSNLRGGQVAGKSRVLSTNIRSSGNAVQSQVRQAISQAMSRGAHINTKA